MNLFDGPFALNVMDPGGDTGMALLLVQPRSFLLEDWAVVPYTPGGDALLKTLRGWRTETERIPGVLLYESFHLRSNKFVPDTSAINVLEQVNMWVDQERSRSHGHWPYSLITSIPPSQAKSTVPDKVLDRLNLKVQGSGSRHVRDALRHAVLWLASYTYLPVASRAWPRR